jgi:uncharacterized protein (DUF362 family)
MTIRITRREFIKKTYGVGIALGLASVIPGFDPLLAEEEPGGQEPGVDLAVVKGDPDAAVRRAVALLGGISSFVSKGDKVLIKPNMSFANPPSWGSTTDPKVIRSVCDLCLEAEAKQVIVLDHTLRSPESCLRETGIREAVSDLDRVAVVAANSERLFTKVTVPKGEALKETMIARQIEKCDCFINMPCAKSHGATGVSFGMKNLMGLVWDRRYFHEKTDLNKAIAELATLIRPNLIILDASRALLTGGPGGPGKVKVLGTVVAGTDQVAVDSFGTTLAPWYEQTFTGSQVRHIVEAHKLGLGEIELDKLRIKRVDV